MRASPPLGCCSGEEDLGGVDVALGDLGLGVAGFHLHVGHGVSCSRLVGQGGVAQVVEGAEGLGDPLWVSSRCVSSILATGLV